MNICWFVLSETMCLSLGTSNPWSKTKTTYAENQAIWSLKVCRLWRRYSRFQTDHRGVDLLAKHKNDRPNFWSTSGGACNTWWTISPKNIKYPDIDVFSCQDDCSIFHLHSLSLVTSTNTFNVSFNEKTPLRCRDEGSGAHVEQAHGFGKEPHIQRQPRETSAANCRCKFHFLMIIWKFQLKRNFFGSNFLSWN